MKKSIMYIMAICTITAVGFFGFKFYSDNQFGTPDLANGKKHFTNNCVVCHGSKGLGNGIMSNNLAVTPDNIYEELTNPLSLKMELIGSVRDGDNGQGGVMPAFKEVLSEKDVNDIFAYIESVNVSSK